jgi:carboxypeptidase family protein/TonB-dependent receptor-like protein
LKRPVFYILYIVLLSNLTCVSLWSQATAQVSGTVKDQSGAVLPGVEITATQTDTGIARSTVTNETGSYVLPNLVTGPYRLEAALPGFRSFVQTGIVLQVNANPVINPVLEVGQVSESVEVQANATQVETRSAGVGTVIENQRVLDLPLNGRNVTDLITLSGMAVYTGSGGGHSRTGVNISVAGGMSFGVQYSLDGAPHLNTYDGTGMPLPFPDALQEFRLATSAQDASNGMHSGAAVNSVMKSGTNAFHGDMFEFVRNNAFNARDFFAVKNDGLKRHQFGGTIGGPIRKDKVFFFAGYQGTTIRQTPANSTSFVPTAQMLAGDFTAFASAACNGGRAVTLRAPFVNNRIDPAQYSRAALNVAARLPKTNDPCGVFLTGNILHENNLQIPVRFDYQRNDKQTYFARYMVTRIETAVPFDLAPDNVLTSTVRGYDNTAQSLTLGNTYLVSAQVVNSFRIYGNRASNFEPGAKFFGPEDVGIKAYSYVPKFITMPVSGGFSLGNQTGGPNPFGHSTNFGVNDDLSILRGSHQLAFGANVMRAILWTTSNTFSTGSYSINGSVTGLGLADFLLGQVNQIRQANPNPINIYQNFFGLYGQDTWKLTPRFTFTYGVRWEPFLPMQFKQGDVYSFSITKFYANQKSGVIPNSPPGFTYPGDPGFNGKSGLQSNFSHIDPRVAFAWDPSGDGKMAVRAGAGIAHDFIRQDLHQNTSSSSPFRLQILNQGLLLDDPWRNYPGGNPFPYNYDKKNPVFVPYGTYLPIPPDMKTTTQYSWNFGLQRQMTPDWFASATYVGTQILHVWNAIELNPAQFLGLRPCTLTTATGPVSYPVCSTLANINQRRRFNLANPQANLGFLTQYDDGGTQNYNGLLLNSSLRIGQNVNLNANYTWSHCIGLPVITLLNPGANYNHQAYQNNGPDDRNMDVGNCSQDRRQIGNATLVVRSPKFSNDTLRRFASGWAVATIYTQRTGSYLTIGSGVDQAMNGFSGQRAMQVLANPYGDKNSLTNYLNSAAFTQPGTGAYGNVGPANIIGPGFWEWDQSISRQFQIREGQRIEFRAEAFNVTNSLRRGNPGTGINNLNTFGVIRSSAGDPRIMQFALKYVF